MTAEALREEFDALTGARRDLERRITAVAVGIVEDWLARGGLEEVLVDDGNERPCYAVVDGEVCDDDLVNDAVSWLPCHAITNSTPGQGWNPVVRRATLRQLHRPAPAEPK